MTQGQRLRVSVFTPKGLAWASGLRLSRVALFLARQAWFMDEEGTRHEEQFEVTPHTEHRTSPAEMANGSCDSCTG